VESDEIIGREVKRRKKDGIEIVILACKNPWGRVGSQLALI
jgi:hypothetical protein